MSKGIKELERQKEQLGSYRALTELINRAIKRQGGIPVTRSAVYKWVQKRRIPAGRVAAIESATGITRQTLRPDLYK